MFLLEILFKVVSNFGTYIFNTNKRIILIDDSNTKTKSNKIIPFSKIDSISFGKDWIQLNTQTTIIKIQNIRDIQRLNKEINDSLDTHKTIDINITKTTEKDVADKIAKLKVLYDEGILTEYEFATKKMELLDKSK